MKISVNDVELFTLSENQKKVLSYDISSEVLDSDLKRRLQWILMHKHEKVMHQLKKDWVPKLIERGLTAVPVNDEELSKLIFAQEDYVDRLSKDQANAKQVLGQ